MHDPEFLTIPEADDENISTRDALKAPDTEHLKEAICKEVTDLIDTTETLRALTQEEVKAIPRYWQIGTTLKCKRKKKGSGLRSTWRPASRKDSKGETAHASDIQPNCQQATHLRIHDANSNHHGANMVHGRHQEGSISQRSASSGRNTDTDQVGIICGRDLRTGSQSVISHRQMSIWVTGLW
jgi:hypothetical protein